MSKKSRKRNKRLLMLAALAGGAALMGRNKRIRATDSPGNEFAKARATMTDLPDYNPPKAAVVRKDVPDVVPDVVPVKKPKKKIDLGLAYQSSRAAGNYSDYKPAPKRVKNILIKGRTNADMGRKIPFHPARGNVRPTMADIARSSQYGSKDGGRIGANKGGSVTGIAKRGFGRALKKK